jgi:molybdopterin-guanine dinucleotide biosynthesis protein A
MVGETLTTTDPKSSSVSGILLAGGKSRRMGGVNKALLEVGGRRIIERAVATLKDLFTEIVLITNSPEDFEFLGLPMFRDKIPGAGSLGGLYTGLSVTTADYGFLAACDMPFILAGPIKHLLNSIDDHDVVIPRVQGFLEPLHAVYSRRCLPFIEELLAQGNLRIIDFLDTVDVLEIPDEDLKRFDPELRFIVNLNTPEQLQQARKTALKLDGARYNSRSQEII